MGLTLAKGMSCSMSVWQGYYPFERMPRTVNPPSGLVYNANNTPYRSSIGEGQPKTKDYESSMGI